VKLKEIKIRVYSGNASGHTVEKWCGRQDSQNKSQKEEISEPERVDLNR
jgi:hypothetical protein